MTVTALTIARPSARRKRGLHRTAPNLYRYATKKGTRFAVRVECRGRDVWRQGFTDKEQAKTYLNAFRRQVVSAKHLPAPPEAPTLTEYGAHWLQHVRMRGLKHNTLRSYEDNLRLHVYPALGDKRLDEIRRADIQALMLAKHQAGLAGNSIRLILAPLSAICSYAIDHDVITSNPAERPGRLLPIRRRKHDLEVFTPKEVRAILAACRRRKPDHYALVLTLFRTPLRIGEVLALEWTDVDFKAGRLAITKNFTNGTLERLPKEGRNRRVELPSDLAIALRRRRRRVKDPLLFPGGSTGGHLHLRSWRRWVWEKVLEAAKVSPRGLHATRHTWVTNQLRAGKSLWWVKEQCGHSSIQVTYDIYGHLAT